MKKNVNKHFESTRFTIVMVSIFLGFLSCLLFATILPKFPHKDFLLYLAPVTLGAYGIKTYEDIRRTKNEYEEENQKALRDFI